MLRWLYRLVVLACPSDVRRESGQEMEEIFVFCVMQRSRVGGPVAGAAAVLRGFADALSFAVSARRDRTHATWHHAVSTGFVPRKPPLMRKQTLTAVLRFIRHQPLFAGAIVLMLALGMGATTALFSVVYGVLLQPLGYPDADRIVEVYGTRPDRGWRAVSFTEANFWDFADMSKTMTLGAWHGASAVLLDGAEPERMEGALVTSGFFRALGLTPLLGRTFMPDDDKPGAMGAMRPAILSEDLWRRRYGAAKDVVGKTVLLGSGPRTIVGVMPNAIPFFTGEEIYFPFVRRADADRGSFEYTVVGRMKPGVTSEQAMADLKGIAAALERQYPENKGMGVGMDPSSSWIASDALRRTLWLLLASVGLLLVIACVNVSNLMLTRASARMRESAVRTAIGATRADIVREWLFESLVLSGIAMILGLALAIGLLQLVRVFGPTDVPRLADVTVNLWAFAVAAGVALVVGVATGLVPALHSPVTDLVNALRHGQRGAVGDRRQDRLRQIFVAAEVALSLLLLVAAGLLARSLSQVMSIDRGFQTDHRLVANLTAPGGYAPPRMARIINDIIDHVHAMPQVQSVAFVSSRPLSNGSTGLGFAAGDRPDDGTGVPWATWRVISSEYFEAMGLPVVAGRTFARDEPSKPRRTVISKRVADVLWPGQNAVGRTIILWKGQGDERWDVIGVVGNMRERGLENDPTLAVYFPIDQERGSGYSDLIIRTKVEPTSIVSDLKGAIAAVDPKLPLSNVRSLEDIVSTSVSTRRFTMMLLAAFAALALVLALAGVAGVLAYSIARRTPEIGLRLALGAEHHGLLRFVMGQGLRPVVAGLVLGLGATFWLSTLMSSLLFGITPRDPLTYAVVCGTLVLTTLVACYVPARRVLAVDPSVSLRAD